MNEQQFGSVKSADRVLDLFELLARMGKGMSHSEISDSLEIPKSSLTQLLKNLITRGYLSFSAKDRHYRLGDQFSLLARQTSLAQDLISLAEPLLADITRETGESCALNIREGDELKVVSSVSSNQKLVTHLRTGDLAPLYATSGGKAILAYLPPDELKSYITRTKLIAVTPKTITTFAKLSKQLARVRNEGIADVFDEFTNGIVGIAAPVLAAGQPIAAINVAMPSVRYSPQIRESVVDALKAAAEILARRLS